MATRRTQVGDPLAEHREVVAWYRAELAAPAPPPDAMRYPPVAIGPTWQRTPQGLWLLPERTLGWEVLGWSGLNLQHARGKPWRYTMEQARFLLWWFALEDDGTWSHRDGVLQRLKGWGKDPLGACLCSVEAFGPARFLEWDTDDQPVATDVPDAWVQTAAVSLEQTKNTTRLFPGLFTDDAKRRLGLVIGKELVHGLGDTRLIQAVTSSPATLEGARSTFVLLNETHHWLANNDGHEMAAVIRRNAAKSEQGAARTLRITNAFEPGQESVAEQDREAWELADAGVSLTTGLLYDSLEAPPQAPLALEPDPGEDRESFVARLTDTIDHVVQGVRGDSVWLSVPAIVQEVLDTRNPPSRSRRYWYNQVEAAEDAWLDPRAWDALARPDVVVADKTEVVLFFDGSKSDDATGLVGCEMVGGHVFTVAMWQRPAGSRGDGWTVPRDDVDHVVRQTMEQYRVVGFYADPSHTRDDESQDRYWDALLDEWHLRWHKRLLIWATPGSRGHSVVWDMASPTRSEAFTYAAERFADDVATGALTHDGDSRLRIHVHNARRAPNRWGVSLRKAHRESPRKVDLGVCAVGARMVRRDVMNSGKWKPRTGRASFV